MSSQVSVSLNTAEIKKLIPALNSLMAGIPGIKAEAGEYKNLLITVNKLLDQIYGPIPEMAELLKSNDILPETKNSLRYVAAHIRTRKEWDERLVAALKELNPLQAISSLDDVKNPLNILKAVKKMYKNPLTWMDSIKAGYDGTHHGTPLQRRIITTLSSEGEDKKQRIANLKEYEFQAGFISKYHGPFGEIKPRYSADYDPYRGYKFLQQEREYNRDFLTSPDSVPYGAEQNNYFTGELLLPIDLTSSIGQFNDLRDASKETLSGLADDIRTTSTRAWQPFSNSITDASLKFSNELTPAGDDAFTAFDDGLGGLGTGFGTVDTAATSLFNLTGTGFGNSLAATQNYQENGLDILGLSLGSQLPTQLGIFQSTHDTAFGQMQGVTNATYTKMGLAAHDFFDDVGFQASSVLGGLMTGEINSLDDAWETLVDGMGTSFENMLSSLTQSLMNWATGSLAELAGAGFQDILAGLFNTGKGGNLSSTFDNILGSILGGGGGSGGSGVLGSILSGSGDSGGGLMMDFFTAGGGGNSIGGDLVFDLTNSQLPEELFSSLGDSGYELAENVLDLGADQAWGNAASSLKDSISSNIIEPITSYLNNSEFISSIGGTSGLAAVGTGLLAFDALVRFMPGGDPEGVVGGLKKTIGAAFGLTELDSLDPKRAALKYGMNQDYLGRVEDASGASFLSTDAAESGYKMDVYAGVMGLTPEEMDLVNLGLTGINEQMEALQLNLEEATRLGDEEWAASLEQQQEELLQQTEQLMAINEQYGIGVEGLGQQNAAMLELSTASEQMAVSLNNLGLAYENSHQHKMDEAAATADLVGYYQEMVSQVDELSGGAVVLGEDAEDLVNQFLSGQVTSEQFAQSMQEKLLAAMQKAQEEGKLLADQMNAIADAIESIPTEWSSTVTTNYVSNGDRPEQHHSGGLILHSGGRAASPLARMYGGMTRYHSGAYVSKLAQDEVPAVLQRGEFVIRRDSVNAATLPSLKAINASGRASTGTGDIIINAPLINIEGNLIGDEDSKEDMVREIETRLRSLANSRFKS